jgi:hypothetical protein
MARTDGDTWELASSVGATPRWWPAAAPWPRPPPTPRDRNDPVTRHRWSRGRRRLLHRLVDGEIAESDLGDDPQVNLARFAM